MKGKYFEELGIGQEFLSDQRTVREDEQRSFVTLARLDNPLFTDEEFARSQGYGGRIVPGPMTVCFALGLTDELGQGTVLAALALDNVRFKAIVRPGDTLQVRTVVADKQESRSKNDRGTITLRHWVYNQRGEEVCSFQRTLLFLRKSNSG
ncbi:MAG: MaoC family dehydratase [Chloroflexi bacterium]|nr:MaoC family dehydratase [Chloroflexota bacterium]